MQRSLWLDPYGGGIALFTLLFSWILFSIDTAMIFRSFLAALLTSGLVWISYVMLRWLVLSFRGR
jgi:hypothetical protein